MKCLILLLIAATAASAAATVVQETSCNSLAASAVCVMPGASTAGNLLVVVAIRYGAFVCVNGDVTDTLGTSFTIRVSDINVLGDSNQTCIFTGLLASSGSNTVTRALTGQPHHVRVFEISGGTSYAIAATAANGVNTTSATSIATGNITTAAAHNLLVCGSGTGGNHPPPAYTGMTPTPDAFWSDGLLDAGFGTYASAGFAYQFVAAGTYNCTFSLSIGAGRMSAAGLAISYDPSSHPRFTGSIQ